MIIDVYCSRVCALEGGGEVSDCVLYVVCAVGPRPEVSRGAGIRTSRSSPKCLCFSFPDSLFCVLKVGRHMLASSSRMCGLEESPHGMMGEANAKSQACLNQVISIGNRFFFCHV